MRLITRLVGLVLAFTLTLPPLTAGAQPTRKVPRIGFLHVLPPSAAFLALRPGLGEFGCIEGQNIAYEYRSADGKAERLPALAADPAATVRRVVSERMLAPIGGPISRLTDRIRISPDSRHVVFVAVTPSGGRVYLDGKAGPGPYTLISDPQFSPNSARLAYSATTKDRTTLVLDGVEGPWYDVVLGALFSPNSARVAYSVFTRMPAPVWMEAAGGDRWYAQRAFSEPQRALHHLQP